jgi:hypothetical protein
MPYKTNRLVKYIVLARVNYLGIYMHKLHGVCTGTHSRSTDRSVPNDF